MPEPLASALGWLPHELALLVETLLKIVALLVPLLVTVAWYTYAERKVIGYMQVRLGPNRVGPKGLLQPIADAVKLLFKEFIVPAGANRLLFVAAPVISLASALAAWAVVPFTDFLVVADINAGLLYILAMTSLGVYGVIIAGWSSNSKYALLGAMRSAAQIVAYEIAMGFALVVVLMAAGSLNLREIVLAQARAARRSPTRTRGRGETYRRSGRRLSGTTIRTSMPLYRRRTRRRETTWGRSSAGLACACWRCTASSSLRGASTFTWTTLRTPTQSP